MPDGVRRDRASGKLRVLPREALCSPTVSTSIRPTDY
jgi:hypothetical protein